MSKLQQPGGISMEQSTHSALRQNHQRIVDAFFGINLTLGLFQICADGPLGSTRECEEGCNFNNDCPIEQVTFSSSAGSSQKCKKMPRWEKEAGKGWSDWDAVSGRRLRSKDRQRIQSDGFNHHRIHRNSFHRFHPQLLLKPVEGMVGRIGKDW